MSTDRYQTPLAERYASKEMQYIFSPDKKFRTWRKLWIALAETEKELGLDITDEQIEELKAHQDDINYEVAKEREKLVRHDVMSHVYAYGVQCPKAKGIIHLGATSCYVGDNTDLIVMTEALKLVRKKLVNVMAEYIGTVHHEINYTVQEGLDALRDVIYFIETYDVTTVRASTPMYLLARVIKSMGIKMVLSGEGADEVFGGYLYFHKAPTPQAFHEETVRKLSKLHMYDCLRANKSLSAWGVEGRVPFLDKEFLDVAMNLNPKAKMCPGKEIEKRIVREAFAEMLPESVAWRQKEQFSDGVGYSWIDTLREITAAAVSDQQMEHAAERFPINTPQNKEEYYYRSIFEEHFPSESAARTVPSVPSVACSTAEALAWDIAFRNLNEPSGRAVRGIHEEAYT